jgi:hypothetical protein
LTRAHTLTPAAAPRHHHRQTSHAGSFARIAIVLWNGNETVARNALIAWALGCAPAAAPARARDTR